MVSSHDPGRVQNLLRGLEFGEDGKKNYPPLLLYTIKPDKGPLNVVLVFSSACAQIKDGGSLIEACNYQQTVNSLAWMT